ncbi:hypothetical protein Fmac_011456 [Flemingia macrophylla]|uniref:Uncharacterized protein n=1 Tax=Flemingia macrophylla TaxID=520843 RepID=A0ABD1MPK9_9FABA
MDAPNPSFSEASPLLANLPSRGIFSSTVVSSRHVGKESEMLNLDVQALERKSTVNAGYINEAVQLYEQNSMHELFQGN